MQIIIDIPEEIYKASQILDVKYEDTVQIPLEVIANGSSLDKIRADIIDLAEGWNGMQAKDVPLGAVLKVIDKHTSRKEK